MDKIKAISPQIIVTGDVDKPFYHIHYYDTADNKWHIGYESYNYSCVRVWLSECFIVIESDVVPVRHGKWIYDNWYEFKCSECGEYSNSKPYKGKENFCPNCGAKMDGGEGE